MTTTTIPQHLLVYDQHDWRDQAPRPGELARECPPTWGLTLREAWRRAQDAWCNEQQPRLDRGQFEELQRAQLAEPTE